MVVFFSKVNPTFAQRTKTKQKTGLDVCLSMISKKIGITHIHVDSHDQVLNILRANKNIRIAIFEALNFGAKSLKVIEADFGIKVYVHIHSKYPFLAVEPISHKIISDLNRLDIGVIFNDQSMLSCFPNEKNIVLENIYLHGQDMPLPSIFHNYNGGFINVGCHGSLRHMKNIPIQAMAAVKIADRINKNLRFHINATRHDGEGDAVLMSLRSIVSGKHELVECPYMDHEKFKSYCRSLDIGMQVSLSETFNMVAADYISSGVPIVVSDQVKWASEMSYAKYDCIDSIVARLHLNINNPVLVKRNQELLKRHSYKATGQWLKFVAE